MVAKLGPVRDNNLEVSWGPSDGVATTGEEALHPSEDASATNDGPVGVGSVSRACTLTLCLDATLTPFAAGGEPAADDRAVAAVRWVGKGKCSLHSL
jgi:hypothetical protein